MTLLYRSVLAAASLSAVFTLTACQPSTDSIADAETEQTIETSPSNTSTSNLKGSDETTNTESYIDNNISASDMVADIAPMSDMLKDYNRSVTRMRDESMIGMNYNDPDPAFAKSMLGHHRGAIDLATIELKYGTDDTMRQLAQQIINKQQVELAVINKWLASHLDTANPKLETPFVQQEYRDHTQPMYNEMMLGITDPIPDIAFARVMLAHHKGAAQMARIELKYGTDEQMLTLARAIIAAHQPEIEQLQNWLAAQRPEFNDDISLNDATIDGATDNDMSKSDNKTAVKPAA